MIELGRENLLDDGEYVVAKVRKHWIVYVEDFFLHALGCIVFIVSAYFLATRGSFASIAGSEFGAMILVGFVLIFWTSFFYAWTKDYFDVWYLTNQHIIAINQKEIFNRDEAFMELVRIQDVSFERVGFLSNLFGYGTLSVQSAGTDQEFSIDYIAGVESVSRMIMDARDEAQGKVQPVANSL